MEIDTNSTAFFQISPEETAALSSILDKMLADLRALQFNGTPVTVRSEAPPISFRHLEAPADKGLTPVRRTWHALAINVDLSQNLERLSAAISALIPAFEKDLVTLEKWDEVSSAVPIIEVSYVKVVNEAPESREFSIVVSFQLWDQ